LKIKSIYLLSSVRDELVRNIQIKLSVDMITEKLTEHLARFTQKNSGNSNLRVQIIDPAENISVDMFCRTQRVALSDELIEFLSNNHEIEFKLY